ncbi:site-specific DNA-methyltransferase [Vibrio parahaemolyticus]|nr:site-specific DNA-methyltransferase [Vibrio parahaemolyticus]MDF4795024.1 site-specific DNA-methyltransferase [Vibrio parahaemolyticus]MDG2685310.1 site-specific DNA-methyltransferase [Vibrio parahaemolyticus]HCG8844303.1 site-specific DNA-methyltransferase [Vibrio parahaemolyticus]
MNIKEETVYSNVETANSKQLAILKKHFPNCFDRDGNFIQERMLEVVNDSEIELSKESYSLNWLGKSYSRLLANLPPKTLIHADVEHNTQDRHKDSNNLLIKGDNLEVLKHLVNAYSEKVKMIYIDPPYNTGSDGFVYNDDRKFTKEQLAELAGIDLDEAERILSFADQGSSSHSAWLTFMYPRLYVARELLADDGVIFISIDDNEVSQLKSLCDEIFGEFNFLGQLIWNTEGNTDNQYKIKVNHEYILAYYKDSRFSDEAIGYVIDPHTPEDSNLRKGFADNNINKNNPANPPSIIELPIGFPCAEKELVYTAKKVDEEFFEQAYDEKFISDELKVKYNIEKKTGLPVKLDDMVVKDYKLTKPCRIFVGLANKNKLLEFISNDCKPILDDGSPIEFYINASAAVRYRKERDKARNILSVLKDFGTTEKSKTELKKDGIYFDYPKPVNLIKYLIQVGCESDERIVLDFFAGSGSTAQALYNLDEEENKNRQFVLVQLDEPIKNKNDKSGSKTIFDITKSRILNSVSKFSNTRLGFKIFETVEDFRVEEAEKELTLSNLTMFDDVLLTDEQYQTLLTTWVLYDGSELTTPIYDIDLDGYRAHLCDRRLYMIAPDFSSKALKALLHKLDDTDDRDFDPNKIIYYANNFDSVKQMELNEALKSYANKKSIEIDVVVRN